MTALELWGTPVRVHTLDPSARTVATRLVGRCLTAVRTAADPWAADGAPQRLAAAGGRPVQVPDLFADLLDAALDAAAATDGALDPTVGNAVVRGASRPGRRGLVDGRAPGRRHVRFVHPHLAALPVCGSTPTTATAARVAGWRSVEQAGRRVAVPAGTLLDVTAVAEPFLAVAASAHAAIRLGTGVLVEVGGDAASHGPVPVGGWRVAAGQRDGDGLRLGAARAVSTVGATQVVDPSSGTLVTPVWSSVSVTGPGCIGSKALALAAHVHGADAVAWLAEQGAVARLEALDGAVVHVGSWPGRDLVPAQPGPGHLAAAS